MKTKYLIPGALIALLSLTIPFHTNAQTAKVWSIGPEAGFSVSRYGQDAGSNDFKPGFVGGMFVTYSIINTFGVTTKFLFNQKGAGFPSQDMRQTLNYFEVPVIGRFFLNKEGQVRPNIVFGPSFAFLTGAKNKAENGSVENIESYKNTFNTFDFGLTGGMGVNIRIQNETYLVLDGRYTHGVSDISKDDRDINNNAFAFTAGVSFGFK